MIAEVLHHSRLAPPSADREARRLVEINAAAGDASRAPEIVDRLVATWLAERGLAGFDDPAAIAAAAAIVPGWAARTHRAGGLVDTLLPGWRIDFIGAMAVLTPPATAQQADPLPHAEQIAPPKPVTGHGPTPARSLLAAAFGALLEGLLAAEPSREAAHVR